MELQCKPREWWAFRLWCSAIHGMHQILPYTKCTQTHRDWSPHLSARANIIRAQSVGFIMHCWCTGECSPYQMRFNGARKSIWKALIWIHRQRDKLKWTYKIYFGNCETKCYFVVWYLYCLCDALFCNRSEAHTHTHTKSSHFDNGFWEMYSAP